MGYSLLQLFDGNAQKRMLNSWQDLAKDFPQEGRLIRTSNE